VKAIKKIHWFIIGALVLLLATWASAHRIMDYYEKSQLEPDVELRQALNKMPQLDSFRYRLESGFTVNKRKEVISKVEGETEHGNTHIKGEMVNTPIDIYYLDRTIYNYDSFSKKWLVIESGTSNSAELLISELNPLSNFRFKTLKGIKKVKFEKIDGAECLVVESRPTVESQLLETLWGNFDYRLWIDYHDNLIRKAELTAQNKRNEKTRLSIKVEFYDFDQAMKIKAPDRSANKN